MATPVALVRRRALAVLIVACAASTACDWPWRDDMVNQPSRPAAAGPRTPAAGAIAMEASPLEREASGRQPERDASAERGRALYQKYCFACHGGAVEQYFPPMPQLSSPEVQQHDDGWLYMTITRGTALMPSYGHELAPRERWEIVRFLRTMAR